MIKYNTSIEVNENQYNYLKINYIGIIAHKIIDKKYL